MGNGQEIMFCNVVAEQKIIRDYFRDLKRENKVFGKQSYFCLVGSKMVLKKKYNEELKIDIDEKLSYIDIIDRIRCVNGLLSLGIKTMDIRQTKKGCHVRMITNCRKLSNKDVLLIQGLMGDDYKRGCLNYKRVMRGETNWNVLFSKKWGSDGKVKSKEGKQKILDI